MFCFKIFWEKMFDLENLLSEDVLREISSVRRRLDIKKNDLAVVLFSFYFLR